MFLWAALIRAALSRCGRAKSKFLLITLTATLACAGAFGAGLRVDITPAEAVAAGAQWRVDGGAWQNSGTAVALSTGSHTVSFSTTTGWTTPASQNVTIYQDQATTTTGTYVPPGGLQVTITPAEAVIEGAQWQADGGPWQMSGATVLGLAPGLHTVGFSTIPGFILISAVEGVGKVGLEQ
ncbi:MAG TPA: hypothetical protein PLU91_20010 [Verrucomicrobiota bacterium]|nr:hypothetical protein [Verrucomicrobiota bacterium]